MKINDRRVYTPFGDFHIEVDNLVDQLFGDRKSNCGTSGKSDSIGLPVAVVESDTDYSLTFELPGVGSGDVKVEFLDGVLEVSGDKQIAELAEGVKYLRNERSKGTFKRSFEFSKPVNGEQISASFTNGLLIVSVPKSEKVLPKKIEIKTD